MGSSSKDVEKKRKHASSHKTEKPSKKQALRSIAPLKVQFIQNQNGPTPVIGADFTISPDEFTSYLANTA